MSQLRELVNQAKALPGLFSLAGRKALVVGGNKGLGQAMSLALASAGADVCIAARGPAGLEETAAAIGEFGVKGMCLAVDVTREDRVEKLVADVVGGLGGLDILINSQGVTHLEPSVEFDLDEWQKVMDVNLKSLVLTCKHAGRVMLEKGYGKIINISSVRSLQGRAGDLAYAPSKGAVNQLTRSLAIEWGPKGINVNAIGPCFFKTEISAQTLDVPEKKAWVLSRIPMKRIGMPADLFGPALFLASDASNFVNGHLLMVDGGWVIA